MAVEIGSFFPEADRQRITPVTYQETDYEVSEQLWKHENHDDHPPVWQVGIHLDDPDRASISTIDELVHQLAHQIEKIEVVRRLDYEFDTMSGGEYAVFEKEADKSGLEVYDDE